MKNPSWSRDEIIIAMAFYMEMEGQIPSKNSSEFKIFKENIDRINAKNGLLDTYSNLRNVNGLYMKLMNFKHLDSSYSGKGLSSVSSLDVEIWNKYVNDHAAVIRLADKIVLTLLSETEIDQSQIFDNEDFVEADEGQIMTRLHTFRERDKKIVRAKKESHLREFGKLSCEVCSFDYLERYGDRGFGYIECHHRKPLCDLEINDKTTLSDLALLCSNCHRMIHRKRPWLSIEELRCKLN